MVAGIRKIVVVVDVMMEEEVKEFRVAVEMEDRGSGGDMEK